MADGEQGARKTTITLLWACGGLLVFSSVWVIGNYALDVSCGFLLFCVVPPIAIAVLLTSLLCLRPPSRRRPPQLLPLVVSYYLRFLLFLTLITVIASFLFIASVMLLSIQHEEDVIGKDEFHGMGAFDLLISMILQSALYVVPVYATFVVLGAEWMRYARTQRTCKRIGGETSEVSQSQQNETEESIIDYADSGERVDREPNKAQFRFRKRGSRDAVDDAEIDEIGSVSSSLPRSVLRTRDGERAECFDVVLEAVAASSGMMLVVVQCLLVLYLALMCNKWNDDLVADNAFYKTVGASERQANRWTNTVAIMFVSVLCSVVMFSVSGASASWQAVWSYLVYHPPPPSLESNRDLPVFSEEDGEEMVNMSAEGSVGYGGAAIHVYSRDKQSLSSRLSCCRRPYIAALIAIASATCFDVSTIVLAVAWMLFIPLGRKLALYFLALCTATCSIMMAAVLYAKHKKEATMCDGHQYEVISETS